MKVKEKKKARTGTGTLDYLRTSETTHSIYHELCLRLLLSHTSTLLRRLTIGGSP